MIRVLPLLVLLCGCSEEGASPRGGSADLPEESGLVFGTPEVYDVEFLDDWEVSTAPSGPAIVARSYEGRLVMTPLFDGGVPFEGPRVPLDGGELLNWLGGGTPSLVSLRVEDRNLLWEVMDRELVPHDDVLPPSHDLEGARSEVALHLSIDGALHSIDLQTGDVVPVPLLDEQWVRWVSTGHGLLAATTTDNDYLHILDAEGELRWVSPNFAGFLMVFLDERTVLAMDVATDDFVVFDLEPEGFMEELERFPRPEMDDRGMNVVASPGGASLVSAQPDEGRAVVIPVTWAPPR